MSNTEYKQVKVVVTTHYLTGDEDFQSDYAEVTMDIQGTTLGPWGDYMRDNGKAVAEGVIEGLRYAYGQENVQVKYKNVADYEA